MWLIGSQKHSVAGLQHHAVQEVDGETSDVTRILGVEPEQQLTVITRCVLPCSSWTGYNRYKRVMFIRARNEKNCCYRK